MPFILMAYWTSTQYFRRCSRLRFGGKRTSTTSGFIMLADNHMIDSAYSGSWLGGGINSVKNDDD